jgi:D-tyrosyl-tRNA(Tyr) deacylase
MWKASVKDIDGEILCVSQFTLMANTTKGNNPDFHNAMVSIFSILLAHNPNIYQSTEPSRELYARFLEKLGNSYHPDKIKGTLETLYGLH